MPRSLLDLSKYPVVLYLHHGLLIDICCQMTGYPEALTCSTLHNDHSWVVERSLARNLLQSRETHSGGEIFFDATGSPHTFIQQAATNLEIMEKLPRDHSVRILEIDRDNNPLCPNTTLEHLFSVQLWQCSRCCSKIAPRKALHSGSARTSDRWLGIFLPNTQCHLVFKDDCFRYLRDRWKPLEIYLQDQGNKKLSSCPDDSS